MNSFIAFQEAKHQNISKAAPRIKFLFLLTSGLFHCNAYGTMTEEMRVQCDSHKSARADDSTFTHEFIHGPEKQFLKFSHLSSQGTQPTLTHRFVFYLSLRHISNPSCNARHFDL